MMNWLRAFMMGRNGLDQLGIGMAVVSILINFISRLIKWQAVSDILAVVAIALMAWVLFRFFSRNLAARRRENERFRQLFSRVQGDYAGWKTRRSQSGEYKFFTCPGCRNRLRVPRGKGKIQITCPKCGQRFGGKS